MTAATQAPGWWRGKSTPERRTVGRTERAVLLRGAVVLAVVGAAGFSAMLVGVLGHSGVQHLDRPVEQWFDAHRDRDLTGLWAFFATVFGPVGLSMMITALAIAVDTHVTVRVPELADATR